ncbi:MPN domain-containing protein-like [Apostichopus japonicus]|uniref:MPN domain-containing protein-like n=1 Tax=Stichopus japonicus TaxID=307972 RepID=UPI003AB10A1C
MDRVEAVMKEDDTNSDAESVESSPSSPRRKRSQFLTGRGVTLRMLMEDGIVEAGEGVLSIDYLGQKFNADLLDDGRIRWTEENMIFNSPSSWAIHIKKLVNPHKRSGCGWSSVKYKGQKLDLVKSRWFCKLNLNKMGLRNGHGDGESGSDYGSEDDETEKPNPPTSDFIKENFKNLEEDKEKEDNDEEKENKENEGLCKSHSGNVLSSIFPVKKVEQYSSLGKRSQDIPSSTLVECKSFKSLGKMQPFTISVTSNSLLLIDFHCHLTTSEVVGYLAGKWDPTSQHMSVLQAYPCKCRLEDKEGAKKVEGEIQQSIALRGLQLVGWYHSHPCTAAHPTIQDIDSQMDYQVRMKGEGNTYQPCLAIICNPYNLQRAVKESTMRSFWVMPSPEVTDPEKHYGMPVNMSYSCQQDMFLTQDVLVELKSLVEFYRNTPDMVYFQENWHSEETFLSKLKDSLAKKFPKDQTDDRLFDYVNELLT